MKIFSKGSRLFLGLVFFAVSLTLISARCSSNGDANTSTAYASSGVSGKISSSSVSFLESLQKANREVSAYVLPSVVTITVVETKKVKTQSYNFPFDFFGWGNNGNDGDSEREYKSEALGSGFIVRKKGNTYYVLTNQHVIGNATDITVVLNNEEHVSAKLVGTDARKDIAMISFEYDKELPVIALGDSDTVKVGDPVFAFGSPMGFESSVTNGIISAVGRSGGPDNQNINDFLQTDTAINQGNSGGPLVNIYGEVIGVNNWIASSSGGSQGLGFSIPINNVKRSIDDFITYGQAKYGWLGIQLASSSDELLESLGIKEKEGALAVQLFIGSPAHKGGILPGDFIIELNGKKVKSYDSLVRDVGDLHAGENAKFTVIRNGKQIELTVKIEERNENMVTDSSKLWPGFSPYPITDKIAKELNLKNKNGVVVAGMGTKTPAVSMGLKTGDVIKKVNDVSVANLKDFYAELSKGSKEFWFEIERDGETFSTIRYKVK
jgi:peptidase Do